MGMPVSLEIRLGSGIDAMVNVASAEGVATLFSPCRNKSPSALV
jgi:hypothetical protein